MPSGCAPIPTSFISITTSSSLLRHLVATVLANARPGHDPGWTPARRLIIRTYDGLSNLKTVALHNSPAHARGCCTEALSDLGADVRLDCPAEGRRFHMSVPVL